MWLTTFRYTKIHFKQSYKWWIQDFLYCKAFETVADLLLSLHCFWSLPFFLFCMTVSSSVYRASRSLHRCTRNLLCFSSCITMFSPPKGDSFTVFPEMHVYCLVQDRY
jgi:hypothetical protein